MDLLQRAADMMDRAQDRMAQAGNEAARIVLSAAQIKALEIRQADLHEQLERATTDLGRVAFQRWKGGGIGNDAELVAACVRVDQINAAYQQVLRDLISTRAAAPVATGVPGLPSAPHYPNPGVPPFSPDPLYPVGPVPPFDTASTPGQPLPPPRLPRAASECPECYTMVPGDVDYCPSCGMRV
jgi:hypothetical protein